MKHNLLIVEDDSSYLGFLKKLFIKSGKMAFNILEASTLNNAVAAILESKVDVILLDLNLPDSCGIETLVKIKNCASDTPVIILTGEDDKLKAIEASKLGAQDYLLKGGDFSKNILFKVEYALERYKAEKDLRSLVFIDELSGLYNFRGFKMHAKNYLANINRPFLLCFMDLDELKLINDVHGHLIGSEAILKTAKIIKATFRETDLYCRFGGDEFLVLVFNTDSDGIDEIDKRLEDNIKNFNSSNDNNYSISLSRGYSVYDPENPLSLEELLKLADRNMYENKSRKKFNSV